MITLNRNAVIGCQFLADNKQLKKLIKETLTKDAVSAGGRRFWGTTELPPAGALAFSATVDDALAGRVAVSAADPALQKLCF